MMRAVTINSEFSLPGPMMNSAKFIKTSNFYTLYGPISCSKKQEAGRLIEFSKKKETTRDWSLFLTVQNIKFTCPAAFKVGSSLLDPL